jgi:hypothetical protein
VTFKNNNSLSVYVVTYSFISLHSNSLLITSSITYFLLKWCNFKKNASKVHIWKVFKVHGFLIEKKSINCQRLLLVHTFMAHFIEDNLAWWYNSVHITGSLSVQILFHFFFFFFFFFSNFKLIHNIFCNFYPFPRRIRTS